MSTDWVQNITDALVAARATGVPAALTPEVLERLDDEAGMRVQHLTLERLQARVAGWKFAVLPEATSSRRRLLTRFSCLAQRCCRGLCMALVASNAR